MSEEQKDRAAFTLEDIRVLRLLAITCGVIFAAMALVIKHQAEMIVAGALVLAIMIACPLVIYLRRRRQVRKDEARGQHTSPGE